MSEHETTPLYDGLTEVAARLRPQVAVRVFDHLRDELADDPTLGLGYGLRLLSTVYGRMGEEDRQTRMMDLARAWMQWQRAQHERDLPDLPLEFDLTWVNHLHGLRMVFGQLRGQSSGDPILGLAVGIGAAAVGEGNLAALIQALERRPVRGLDCFFISDCLSEVGAITEADFPEGVRTDPDLPKLILYHESGLPWDPVLWNLLLTADLSRFTTEVLPVVTSASRRLGRGTPG